MPRLGRVLESDCRGTPVALLLVVRRTEETTMLMTILIVLLVLAVIGGGVGYGRFGYAGLSPAGLLVIILVILFLTGRMG